MVEGYPPPDYIVNNWTDELLELMSEKLRDRKEREAKAMRTGEEPTEVSEQAFLSAASNMIGEKHGSKHR